MDKGKNANTTDQYQRFVEEARKLGADENEEAFKEKMGVIARQKPKQAPAEKPRPGSKAMSRRPPS